MAYLTRSWDTHPLCLDGTQGHEFSRHLDWVVQSPVSIELFYHIHSGRVSRICVLFCKWIWYHHLFIYVSTSLESSVCWTIRPALKGYSKEIQTKTILSTTYVSGVESYTHMNKSRNKIRFLANSNTLRWEMPHYQRLFGNSGLDYRVKYM